MTNKSTKITLALHAASLAVAQGNVYTRPSEDGLIYVFDASIVLTLDGARYYLATHAVPGAYLDDDGCWQPNRRWREEADRLIERIYARGVVDLAHWRLVVDPTPAEREAYNLRCEADERAWS